MITWGKTSNQSCRGVLCTLQWCNGGFRQTGQYCIAIVQFAEYERRNESSCYFWSNEPSDLLETSDVMETRTGDLVDVPLHSQLRVEGNAEVAHNVHRNDDVTANS